MNSKVIVLADETTGAVVNVSENPEFGYIRCQQTKAIIDKNGFLSRKVLTALIPGQIEDLKALGYYDGQVLDANIVVDESLSPFNKKDPSRDLKVAGKTGTTNDNSDLWFMGYTPQILAGAWVGADDRYIRFTDNYFGQGAHGSLPIWAYFMNKVANDPASNLDRNASFVRPDNLSTDFNVNFVGKDSSIDLTVPDTDAEGIAAESDYSLISNNEPAIEVPATNNPPVNKSTLPKKPTTEPKQATTPANKPKAVMPKKQQ